jgi:hypothetical protein
MSVVNRQFITQVFRENFCFIFRMAEKEYVAGKLVALHKEIGG